MTDQDVEGSVVGDVDVEAGTADGLRRSPSFRRGQDGRGDRMSGRVRDRISCLQISLQDLELILPRWYTKSTVYAIDTEWMRRRLEHSVIAPRSEGATAAERSREIETPCLREGFASETVVA